MYDQGVGSHCIAEQMRHPKEVHSATATAQRCQHAVRSRGSDATLARAMHLVHVDTAAAWSYMLQSTRVSFERNSGFIMPLWCLNHTFWDTSRGCRPKQKARACLSAANMARTPPAVKNSGGSVSPLRSTTVTWCCPNAGTALRSAATSASGSGCTAYAVRSAGKVGNAVRNSAERNYRLRRRSRLPGEGLGLDEDASVPTDRHPAGTRAHSHCAIVQ